MKVILCIAGTYSPFYVRTLTAPTISRSCRFYTMTPIFSGFVAVIAEGGSIQRQELSLLLFGERELRDSAQVRPRVVCSFRRAA